MSSPKQYSAKTKFHIVIEALREQHSQIEIARNYGINVKLLSNWKRHFLDHGHTIFESTTKRDESAHKRGRKWGRFSFQDTFGESWGRW